MEWDIREFRVAKGVGRGRDTEVSELRTWNREFGEPET